MWRTISKNPLYNNNIFDDDFYEKIRVIVEVVMLTYIIRWPRLRKLFKIWELAILDVQMKWKIKFETKERQNWMLKLLGCEIFSQWKEEDKRYVIYLLNDKNNMKYMWDIC